MFKAKVENMYHENKGADKVYNEASKLQTRMKSIESEIILLENNIGFFAKSKNADKLIVDFQKKIALSKQEIETIKEQLKVIHSVKEK